MSQNYGPRSSIIWTRRVIVLLVLGSLIWGAIAGVNALIGYFSGIANPNKTPVLVAGSDCQPQNIRVEAFVGNSKQETVLNFDSGEKPYFWFAITNTSSVECVFNVGSSVSFFQVTSGNDNIWDSKDCNPSSPRTDLLMKLSPNKPVTAAADYWRKVRSSSQGCSIQDGQEKVSTGGASYVLRAEVNGVISQNTQQFVLN